MEIIKRNGVKETFNDQKIFNAIYKANQNAEVKPDDRMLDSEISAVTNRVVAKCSAMDKIPGVEDIQDFVEEELMARGFHAVAKAYIKYRYLHTMRRDRYEEMMEIVRDKVTASNVQNQNANVDEFSFGGRMGETSDAILKNYALEYCMSKMARENHLNNEVYIHDLSHYALGDHNCLSVPFDHLLATGFNTRQTDVRPANSVNTAFQLVAVIFQLQSLQQFGGVSATHLDWTMVPYVKKSFYKHYRDGLKYLDEKEMPADFTNEMSIGDEKYKEYSPKAYKFAYDMTEKETFQAVEGMYHNLNTLQSRSGNQLPFTSINYGTCTSPEGRMVIKALLEASIEGVGRLHKTAIFPCGIFQCMKGVNRREGDPNYDLFKLAMRVSAKRFVPAGSQVHCKTPLPELRQCRLVGQRRLRHQRPENIFLNHGLPHGKRLGY